MLAPGERKSSVMGTMVPTWLGLELGLGLGLGLGVGVGFGLNGYDGRHQ